MAKKFKFKFQTKHFIWLAGGITVASIASTVLWVILLDSSITAQHQKEASLSSGDSFVTELTKGDTPEERVTKLTQNIQKMQKKMSDLAAKINSKESSDAIKKVTGIQKNLGELNSTISNSNRTQEQQESRLVRLESLSKKMAGGQTGMAGGGGGGSSSDGAKVLGNGVAVYGSIRKAKKQPLAPPKAKALKTDAKPWQYYIPSGSKIKIRLKSYILAPAGGLQAITGKNAAAYPFFVEIIDDVELADGSIVPLSEEGVALLDAVGDSTNERVMPRLTSLRFYDGNEYFELSSQDVSIYDTIDNAPGLFGKLDTSKRGREMAKAAAVQAVKVFTDTISAQAGAYTPAIPTINPGTGSVTTGTFNLAGAGWAAASGSLGQFVKFYLDNATKYFDTVQVSDKIAIKNKDGSVSIVPHEAWLVFNKPVFVHKITSGG